MHRLANEVANHYVWVMREILSILICACMVTPVAAIDTCQWTHANGDGARLHWLSEDAFFVLDAAGTLVDACAIVNANTVRCTEGASTIEFADYFRENDGPPDYLGYGGPNVFHQTCED